MELAFVDWLIIAIYLVLALGIGIYFKGTASKSLGDFFLGGRRLPWYVAGISMVATTFAADTPLWVTEKIAQHGISGNWLWWNMLIGGMLTTFFFARLWRRANVLTELEFIELRYSGKAAAFLRAFKSVYMGIFLNAVIIGWVNTALGAILQVFFDIPEQNIIYYIMGAMLVVVIYASLSGLLGVAITDFVQFFIAMAGCIILAIVVVNSEPIGGISGLKAQLPAWRFDFFPEINSGSTTDKIGTYSVTIGAFLTFGLVQWWASWYPGAEPGGGGYVAQRMMSAKNEKHAVMATLFFQIAHYCLRPWPWIIVGLCALVLYPNLGVENASQGFVLAMKDYLPAGLKGLLLVAFLSAYMSTISTQLNWGASYLTNDLYKRFIRKKKDNELEEEVQKDYIQKARIFTFLIVLAGLFSTTQMSTIDGAATFLIECGAGLGLVLILRWYWWRVNAWSEITASIAPFGAYLISNQLLGLDYPNNFLLTVGLSTVAWVVVTFLSPRTAESTLQHFYERVQPDGWWKPLRKASPAKSQMVSLLLCWLFSIVLVYSCLFFIGDLIFMNYEKAIIEGIILLIAYIALRFQLKKTRIFEI
ncbi:MAG: sodium:proline symporter [Verrucomicrobia bacterium]|nr:sodium:proline symporter [Verrucomicrobiota bacterium]